MTEKPLCIPIRVHWTRAAIVALVNALPIGLIVSIALGEHQANPPGAEWLGILFGGGCLIAVNALALPMFRNPRVQFDDDRLSIFLGVHKARIPYSGIDFVSERFDGVADTVSYPWKPTAPGAIRIHGRLCEEAVAVADKERFYEELLKRNPNIRIERRS